MVLVGGRPKSSNSLGESLGYKCFVVIDQWRQNSLITIYGAKNENLKSVSGLALGKQGKHL